LGRELGARIRLLPETVVNRIAAGEVIERPAAAVKELVENALDAGAKRIAVALEDGGIALIDVADDGVGMSGDELALAVQRHATSKLADDDLVRITSLGFRGEALPSIGAAARLAITSRPRGAEHANLIRVEGGLVFAVEPAPGPTGTQAVVRDLFFATPARRKFLKSPRSEAEHAEAAVRRLALAAPATAFRLASDGHTLFDLPAQDRAARVAALLGAEAASALVPVAGERDGMALAGFACLPTVTRATSALQALVVNGRPVADPVLKTAVRVAYREVIAANRHAVVALYLTLPPQELDVNVHPAKAELRFRDPAAVRSLVIGALGRALGRGAGAAGGSAGPALRLVASRPAWAASALRAGFAEPQLPLAAAPAARRMAPAEPQPSPSPAAPHPLGAAVAQVLDTYILAVTADGSLVVVDQHAAHERLTEEALREQMLSGPGERGPGKIGQVESQPLLLPAVVELAPAAVARLLAEAADLARLGLVLEGFGAGAVLVRALPAALGAPEPGPLLTDLADELTEMEQSTALEARLDRVVKRLACHGSIRAGRRLTVAEMDHLLRRMEATPRAATCSHGRPTFLKFTRADIETLFRRR
jgi:DNA mismatch repair protein MutL